MLWRSHVMTLGLHWAVVYGSWSLVESGRWSMDRRQVYGGQCPPFSSLSVVHVHRVHVRVAGEGNFPCFLSRRAPAGSERPVSLASGAGARLKWVKAPLSLGVLVGGVNMACGVP